MRRLEFTETTAKQNKKLMFQVSNSLSKIEALDFVKTLDKEDIYYLVKVHENPKARHLAKRERFVIVRDPHKGELVKGAFAKIIGKDQLISVNGS